MLKNENKYKKTYHLLFGLLLSLFIISLSSSLRVLNSNYTGWLSVGDGSNIVSWEFFRNTSFPDWLLGRIPDYGMEMSRSIYFYVPVIYMYPMRVISPLMGEEFQFIGWVIFLNLFLQYFIASKIISLFNKNLYIVFFASTIFLLSPFFLDRFITHEHYFLLSHWLILFAFFLVLKSDYSKYKWSLLIVLSIFHIAYFTAMVLPIYLVFIAFAFFTKKINAVEVISNIITVSISLILALFTIGFFKDSDVGGDSGLGLFRANLHAFFNPAGWSRLIPELSQTYGDYEGFAFLGIATFVIMLISLLNLKSIQNRATFKSLFILFLPIFLATTALFLFSLSTDVVYGTNEIFDFNYPDKIENWVSAFRSTGRFIWPLAYAIMLYFTIFFILTSNKKISVLTLGILVFIQFFDMLPSITSRKDTKFATVYSNPLQSEFWSQVPTCYEAIHQLPAVMISDYHYNFSKVAASNEIGIYPGRTDRVSETQKNQLIVNSKILVRLGNYDPNRIYVFREAKNFTNIELDLEKKIALHTLPKNAIAVEVDGYLVIAPEALECFKLNLDNSKLQPRFDYLTNSYLFDFTDSNKNDSQHLTDGWSTSEPWGTWSSSEWAGVFFMTKESRKFSLVKLTGHGFRWPGKTYPVAEVFLNGVLLGELGPETNELEDFIFRIPKSLAANETFFLEFNFKELKSPYDLGLSEDTRKLGFMLNKAEFS